MEQLEMELTPRHRMLVLHGLNHRALIPAPLVSIFDVVPYCASVTIKLFHSYVERCPGVCRVYLTVEGVSRDPRIHRVCETGPRQLRSVPAFSHPRHSPCQPVGG